MIMPTQTFEQTPDEIRKEERQRIVGRINELSKQFGRNGFDNQWQECAEFMAEEIESIGDTK